jgi:hypothetical protein
MTTKLTMAQLQEQMNHAAEAINEKQFDAAQAAFLECAALTEVLKLADETPAKPTAKQITLDV